MNLLTAAVILAIVHLVSGAAFIRLPARERTLRFLVSFSAGTLLAMSLVHLLPESALYTGGRSGLAVLAGFFALWALEHLVGRHEHVDDVHKHAEHEPATGLSVLASLVLILHGFIDGLALAAFEHHEGWALTALLGLAAHAPAMMLALITLLRLAGMATGPMLGVIAVTSFTIPAGAWAASGGPLSHLAGNIAWFEAAVGGALIYLSTHHLLPAVEHNKRDRLALYAAALAGAVLAVLLAGLHGGEGHHH